MNRRLASYNLLDSIFSYVKYVKDLHSKKIIVF